MVGARLGVGISKYPVRFGSEPGRVKGLSMAREDGGGSNQGRGSGFGHMRCDWSRYSG